MHQLAEGLADELALAIPQDPLDRRALILDRSISADQRDDI